MCLHAGEGAGGGGGGGGGVRQEQGGGLSVIGERKVESP